MSTDNYEYQYNYSDDYDLLYNESERGVKAKKVLSVLQDYLGVTFDMKILDVGCSTGIQTAMIGCHFKEVIGIDIDKNAIKYAKKNYEKDSIKFILADSMNIPFQDCIFDVVLCTHVYEHVPDSIRLLYEINRVLKPGGICYFAAANKYNLDIFEPHYKLPFLSWLPKSLANRYIRLSGKADLYYENLYSFSKLRKITSSFERIDYTKKILTYPDLFNATDMLKTGTIKQKLSLIACDYLYFLLPTYIWILKKR
ncbi:MAG: class I SAM-dependent methyltransferase [Oscillospiraceae bacterium]|nr:class I SAM-dependent methyltransferase [Oscillospiraceae bacterium]